MACKRSPQLDFELPVLLLRLDAGYASVSARLAYGIHFMHSRSAGPTERQSRLPPGVAFPPWYFDCRSFLPPSLHRSWAMPLPPLPRAKPKACSVSVLLLSVFTAFVGVGKKALCPFVSFSCVFPVRFLSSSFSCPWASSLAHLWLSVSERTG